MVSWAAGAKQTKKIGDSLPANKSCIRNPSGSAASCQAPERTGFSEQRPLDEWPPRRKTGAPNPINLIIRFGAMDGAKPYRSIGFGAMDGAKPYRSIGFGAMDGAKPYRSVGFGAMDGAKPYECKTFGAMSGAKSFKIVWFWPCVAPNLIN
jgi:hypothetical protein